MTNPAQAPRDGAPTTLQRTLRPGPARSRGLEGEYRRLVYGPGEPRLVRDDLAGETGALSRELVSLVNIGHLTDMQIADVQSPARFEFFEQLRGLQGAGNFVPAWRPQEALVTHAVAAMVQTINRLATSPETGASLGLCVSTGDSLDNAQLNELQWFLSLLGGGTVMPNSGGPTYQGVQAADWEPGLYWRPDAAQDPYKERFGFPVHPGLLAEALRTFSSPGLAMPWLSCFGNHDGLVLGTALPTPSYERVLLGRTSPSTCQRERAHWRRSMLSPRHRSGSCRGRPGKWYATLDGAASVDGTSSKRTFRPTVTHRATVLAARTWKVRPLMGFTTSTARSRSGWSCSTLQTWTATTKAVSGPRSSDGWRLA